MFGTSINTKGQVTIPMEIRKSLGLKAGDRVTFVTDGDRAILLPVRGDFLSLKGVLKPRFKGQKPLSVEEMRETAKRYVVVRYKKHRRGLR
jgi:AbrB family looped-hinge helix DNA binding protein